jgi:hypothetical protein
LEQASDERTATETALDFPANASVIDGCSGAGADAVALAKRGLNVVAIDRDEVACRIAMANLSMNACSAEVVQGDALEDNADGTRYLHLDPDRRVDGGRTTSPQHMNPSWESIAPRIPKYRGVSLKLAPGSRYKEDFDWGQASPPDCLRWLSVHGSVRQQRWYWRIERWRQGCRVASMLGKEGVWHHEVFDANGFDPTDPEVDMSHRIPILPFVADQDPVVRAAELNLPLAQRLQVHLIGSPMGYYHADHIVRHPMLQWFQVLEILSMDEKKIRAFARGLMARGLAPRVWELKSRGVEIDLERMQRSLATDDRSTKHLTVLFTRQGPKHVAIFSKRIQHHEPVIEKT